MVRVNLKCQIGNVLFQYAVAKSLIAKRPYSCQKIVFDLHDYIYINDLTGNNMVRQIELLGIKDVTYERPYFSRSLSKLRKILKLDRAQRRATFREPPHGYFHDLVEFNGDPITIDGYFQSYKYFEGIENELKRSVSFSPLLKVDEVRRCLDLIGSSQSVSVHVRRGDYLQYESLNVCGLTYYSNAIKAAREQLEDPVFYVFSDDINWCKGNISGNDVVFLESECDDLQPIVDLLFMSRCKHNIISNSTFSWWAAWLNSYSEKQVFCPSRWNKVEENNTHAFEHLISPTWITIKV